jgi:hypothetical protein
MHFYLLCQSYDVIFLSSAMLFYFTFYGISTAIGLNIRGSF